MPSSNNNVRTRKGFHGNLLLVLVGLLPLIVTLVITCNPQLRAILFEEKPATENGLQPRHPVVPQDSGQHLEERLREEYEKKFEVRVKAEMERLRAAGLENREPPPPSRIFEKPSGIISDITDLSNGLPLRTEVLYGTGGTALEEAKAPDSYAATFQLKFRIPRAADKLSEIERATPGLSGILPGFASLFPLGFVSPWHDALYQNKLSEMRIQSKDLAKVPSKPDAYDCNTILHLKSEKGRKVFFMQADMDAVLKGSDGDRQSDMPASLVDSIHYDPFTAYHWRKRGDRANPMVAGWEKRIAIGAKELKEPSITPERKAWVEERIAMLKSGIEAMKRRGYLVSAKDPYIALPLLLLKDASDPFAPKVGDYAVVVHGRKIYPCIVGDKGMDSSAGEASARLALELNPGWKAGTKAVSMPSVSYMVFPNSRETEPGPPDYAQWGKKCRELLNEIGGVGKGYELHQWADPPPKAEGKQ